MANDYAKQLREARKGVTAQPKQEKKKILPKSRVKSLKHVKASSLVPNEMNWRDHSEAQREALGAMFGKIGFSGAIVAREDANGNLVILDGHLRAQEAGDALVPVLITDLTEEEGLALLASYDVIGGMADTNTDVLARLVEDLQARGMSDFAEGGALYDIVSTLTSIEISGNFPQNGIDVDDAYLDSTGAAPQSAPANNGRQEKHSCPKCGHEF